MKLSDYAKKAGVRYETAWRWFKVGAIRGRQLPTGTITHIVVEHKDRATWFGSRYLETLLAQQGRTIEVVNQAENSREELLTDLVAIVYSFAARLYGQRCAKRKTDMIIKELTEGGDDATG